MVRRKDCAGMALAALGTGMILSVLLQGGLCPVILGVGCILAGAVCMK